VFFVAQAIARDGVLAVLQRVRRPSGNLGSTTRDPWLKLESQVDRDVTRERSRGRLQRKAAAARRHDGRRAVRRV
jgi:hypothetical protein